MKIQYDKDFEKVMNELQTNFGWSNLDALPDSFKDLLNDTIMAVKNCSIPTVVGQSEQFHCERFDFGRDKKCEQQCSDCYWMQTKSQ